MKALVRTYCQAYQGVPTKILFDRDTGSYTTNYNMEGRTDAPTVLYYNIDNYYANGYDLSVVSEKGEKAAVNETKKNYLEIKLPSQ